MELRWGQAASLEQRGGVARITNGSWFDQSGDERPEGYLYRLGSNSAGVILFGEAQIPPKTDPTDEGGACTRAGFTRQPEIYIDLYPAWIGHEIIGEVYGGNLSNYTYGDNKIGWLWEWGRHNAHDSAIWPNRSNTLIVQDWRDHEPPPPPPPLVDVEAAKKILREDIARMRSEDDDGALTWDVIKTTASWRAFRKLGGR